MEKKNKNEIPETSTSQLTARILSKVFDCQISILQEIKQHVLNNDIDDEIAKAVEKIDGLTKEISGVGSASEDNVDTGAPSPTPKPDQIPPQKLKRKYKRKSEAPKQGLLKLDNGDTSNTPLIDLLNPPSDKNFFASTKPLKLVVAISSAKRKVDMTHVYKPKSWSGVLTSVIRSAELVSQTLETDILDPITEIKFNSAAPTFLEIAEGAQMESRRSITSDTEVDVISSLCGKRIVFPTKFHYLGKRYAFSATYNTPRKITLIRNIANVLAARGLKLEIMVELKS